MWQYLVAWAVMMVLSSALMPKPRSPDAAPGAMGEIPIASADALIPVVFGTCVLSQPNVVWWGDLSVTPIVRSGGGKKG